MWNWNDTWLSNLISADIGIDYAVSGKWCSLWMTNYQTHVFSVITKQFTVYPKSKIKSYNEVPLHIACIRWCHHQLSYQHICLSRRVHQLNLRDGQYLKHILVPSKCILSITLVKNSRLKNCKGRRAKTLEVTWCI